MAPLRDYRWNLAHNLPAIGNHGIGHPPSMGKGRTPQPTRGFLTKTPASDMPNLREGEIR